MAIFYVLLRAEGQAAKRLDQLHSTGLTMRAWLKDLQQSHLYHPSWHFHEAV
jgi:hypothetical protein